MKFSRVFVALLIVLGLASLAARFLLVDDPQKADAIVILAGETRLRPALGLELLRQGMAPHLFLDVVVFDEIYNQPLTSLADGYLHSVPQGSLPPKSDAAVCPIRGFSTKAEAGDVRKCLQQVGAHKVLLVTSDAHTRRALLIFRHELPEYEFSIAAARNPEQFGFNWWMHREWAKSTVDEWTKLLWFEGVDRWR
jgi:DUF218 domain